MFQIFSQRSIRSEIGFLPMLLLKKIANFKLQISNSNINAMYPNFDGWEFFEIFALWMAQNSTFFQTRKFQVPLNRDAADRTL